MRCFKCGHAFQLTEQYIANALAAQGITGKPTHYVTECPQCRQSNKVSLKRVRLPQAEEWAVTAAEGAGDDDGVSGSGSG